MVRGRDVKPHPRHKAEESEGCTRFQSQSSSYFSRLFSGWFGPFLQGTFMLLNLMDWSGGANGLVIYDTWGHVSVRTCALNGTSLFQESQISCVVCVEYFVKKNCPECFQCTFVIISGTNTLQILVVLKFPKQVILHSYYNNNNNAHFSVLSFLWKTSKMQLHTQKHLNSGLNIQVLGLRAY